MHNEFVLEAARCRERAKYYGGEPEERFLLRMATAFEQLADVHSGHSPCSPEVPAKGSRESTNGS